MEASDINEVSRILRIRQPGRVLFANPNFDSIDDAVRLYDGRRVGRIGTTAFYLAFLAACHRPTAPTPTDQGPSRFNGQPTGTLPAGTRETMASLETRAGASCKYATAAGVDYDVMPSSFSTANGLQHSSLVTGLQDGSNYTLNARCKDASTGAVNTTDYPISFGVLQQTATGVKFTNSIRDIIDGSSPATGTITIDGTAGPQIVNGNYTVTKDMNLALGSTHYLVITANGYNTREGTFRVTGRGFEADLGGGRTEWPLTVYHDIPGIFTAAEYATICLRNGVLHRNTTPLEIAVYDTRIYEGSAGGTILTDKDAFLMRQITKDRLMQKLRDSLPFWTDNKIYTSKNIDSFIHPQSRGDSLPDLSKGGKVQLGWRIVYQMSDKPPDCAICESDDPSLDMKWASLGIRTDQEITEAGWDNDLKTSLGYPKRLDVLKDPKYAPYAKVMFSRPPGHMLPDKSP